MTFYFKRYGKILAQDKKIRGKSIIDAFGFSKYLAKNECSHFKIIFATPKAKKKGYRIALEQKFAMPKNFEVTHTFVHGTTGTGKSQLMSQFLEQALTVQGKKIIFDRNGHAAEVFYRPGDKILNPFDSRTLRWDLFSECCNYEDYKMLAAFLIPEAITSNDKYWVNSPRKVIVDSLMSMEERNILELLYMLSFMTTGELHEELAETSSRRLITEKNERMSSSIEGIISTYMDAFETLVWLEEKKERPAFSIRDWLVDDEEQGTLFIIYPNKQAETLRPLLTLFFSLVIHWSLSLESDPKRRIFVFCDELAAFNRLEKLHPALAEGRKYGLSLFLATQNYFDLVRIYGQHEAKSLLDQMNTKFFFRSKDPETAEFVSKSLWEQEVETVMQNRAYSNNEYRDGVSAYTHKEMRRMVLASEISNMQDLECYLDSMAHPLVHFDLFYKNWGKKASALEQVDTNRNHTILKGFVRSRLASGVKTVDVSISNEKSMSIKKNN